MVPLPTLHFSWRLSFFIVIEKKGSGVKQKKGGVFKVFGVKMLFLFRHVLDKNIKGLDSTMWLQRTNWV
jgi:hypothetical protein